jgi:hypothetical protein
VVQSKGDRCRVEAEMLGFHPAFSSPGTFAGPGEESVLLAKVVSKCLL